MIPKMTNGGRGVMLQSLDGESTVVFTRLVIGNGDCPEHYETLTGLVNQIASVGIDEIEIEDQYATLTGTFTNQGLVNAFSWTEVGLFCQDPDDNTKEILYAYGHYILDEKPNPEAYIPVSGAEAIELQLVYSIYIGPLENVSAVISQSANVTKAEFELHTHDYTNPHRVTAEQVGLGDVVNKAPNNMQVTYSSTSTVSNLVSGETLSNAMKKIAAAIKSLITHLSNTNDHVSPSDRTSWNNKAERNHNHSASDITSGTLAVARGGTGVTTLHALQANLKIPGVYVSSTLYASQWDTDNKVYNLHSVYANDKYNLEVALAPSANSLQMAAFASAAILGSVTGNVLTAKGRVPNIDIPVIIKVMEVL